MGPGAALIETAVAVSLSSVRLFPIVVALIPVVRDRGTRFWHLLIPVHYMAISVWIESMRAAPRLARDQRIPFCHGVGLTLISLGVVFTAVGYFIQALLPAIFAAGAMFMTPISFLVSAARNARLLLDKLALGLGLALGPAFAFAKVDFDLLWAGVIAGTLAYGAHHAQRRWKGAP
jgi:predicted branched-subunit amino acid permease